jgi:rod shape determining protein RodA
MMIQINKLVRSVDWTVVLACALLMTIGILFIYSSGVTTAGDIVTNEYRKQIIWAISAMILLLSTLLIDTNRVSDYIPFIYSILIILLIFTMFFGKVVNGARSWLSIIGDYGIQPSEFMKIATVLFLARYLDRSSHESSSFKRFLISFMIVAFPMFLILLQPDFGTALVFLPLFLSMAYIGGISKRYLFYFILVGGITIILTIMPLWQGMIASKQSMMLRMLYEKPYVYYVLIVLMVSFLLALAGLKFFKKRYYYWSAYIALIFLSGLAASLVGQKVLKEYQVMRLVVFLDPSIDPLGSGWNILQSITAIGNGGFYGKGFLHGTQSQYRYLPQQSTDFIFSIISEELGFIGGIFIFTLFLYILLRLAFSIRGTRTLSASTYIAGVFGILLFHFLINAGMAMGVMPITGIPLLFLSYGGSSLWAISIGVGLCLSIGARRYDS